MDVALGFPFVIVQDIVNNASILLNTNTII